MLTDEERREIESEFPRYATRRAVCIEAMKIVQRHRGWVSDDALKDIGGILGMSPSELDGVATFYNLIFRQPVGRHVIYVRDSVSCWIMNGTEQFRHLAQQLGVQPGETTTDGRFTLLPIVCLGACDRAPVMMVDDDLHTDLEPSKIDGILKDYP
jgi:NADH-quinone oxidoreductase subunit E